MRKYFALLCFLVSSIGFSASFDCKKAVSLSEMLICNDAELSRLDDELSVIYKQAKTRATDDVAFNQQTKAAWLWREKNCQSKECLINWYANRKLILQKIAATHPGSSAAPTQDDVEAEMIRKCESLAELLNKTKNTNININELRAFVTWRATCAEQPPTGEGNVMALCEGTSVRNDGSSELLFFWSKTNRGKLTSGYLSCGLQ